MTDWPIPSMFSSGKAKPITYSTVYPLACAMDGLVALERRETWGKAVVCIREEEEEDNKTMAKL
jgi:NADPH2:quinone reductase